MAIQWNMIHIFWGEQMVDNSKNIPTKSAFIIHKNIDTKIHRKYIFLMPWQKHNKTSQTTKPNTYLYETLDEVQLIYVVIKQLCGSLLIGAEVRRSKEITGIKVT